MVLQALRRFGLSGIALAAVLGACSPSRSDQTVIVFGDDVIASGDLPQMTDTIAGDVMLAGGDMRFSGVSGGDYLGAGGTQAIGGVIRGALRAAGGEVHVTATVDRNATLAGGDIVIDNGAVIGRNAYVAGGKLRIDGTVQGGVRAMGGEVVINGVIGRDVDIRAGSLRIGPRARIAGTVRYQVSDDNVRIDPAAQIGGPVTKIPMPETRGVWYVLGILWALSFLISGLVLVALLPRVATAAADIVQQQPGRAGIFGLGWIVLVPVGVLIAVMTVVGFPLALLGIAAYMTLLYLGRLPVAVWIGRRILGTRVRPGRVGTVLQFGLGALILLVVGMIPVIGNFTMLLATVIGLGALLLQIRTWRVTRSTAVEEGLP